MFIVFPSDLEHIPQKRHLPEWVFTRMGDVVLINTGDGVFTGREPHTSHQPNESLQ